MARKINQGDEIQQAIKQCPDWLKARIVTQSRNLLALHRIQGARVSTQTCLTLLNTQGLLIAKLLFDKAAQDADDFIKQLEQPAECACVPATDNVDVKGTCMQCGKPWKPSPAVITGPVTDPDLERALSSSLESVAESCDQKVKAHIAECADPGVGCGGQ